MNKTKQYRKAILSFIDILGFGDIVKKKSADEIYKILHTLHGETKIGAKKRISKDKDQTKIIYFSDSIVRIRTYDKGNEYSDGPLYFELSAIALAQWLLVEKGILIRGGVTHGDIYTNSDVDMLFGPAMNKGYMLESKFAIYPRIILDQETLECLKKESRLRHVKTTFDEEREAIKKYLDQGDDGIWYIDYLGYGCKYSQTRSIMSNSNEQPEDLVIDTLSKHRNIIIDLAGNENINDAILVKIKWLIKYHNSKCKIYKKEELELKQSDISVKFEF